MTVSQENSERVFLWNPELLYQLPTPIAEKMGQTLLSRISYHRRVARNSGRIRLSQAIGILLWLNRYDLLSQKGSDRLLFLQSKASFEAIESGLKFCQRLLSEEKLVLDFYHHIVDQNTRPSSKRFRKYREQRRIGIGYRDKGTLPSPSARGREEANRESWVLEEDLLEILEIITIYPPSDLKEGEWIDLPGYVRFLREKDISQDKIDTLLTLL